MGLVMVVVVVRVVVLMMGVVVVIMVMVILVMAATLVMMMGVVVLMVMVVVVLLMMVVLVLVIVTYHNFGSTRPCHHSSLVYSHISHSLDNNVPSRTSPLYRHHTTPLEVKGGYTHTPRILDRQLRNLPCSSSHVCPLLQSKARRIMKVESLYRQRKREK